MREEKKNPMNIKIADSECIHMNGTLSNFSKWFKSREKKIKIPIRKSILTNRWIVISFLVSNERRNKKNVIHLYEWKRTWIHLFFVVYFWKYLKDMKTERIHHLLTTHTIDVNKNKKKIVVRNDVLYICLYVCTYNMENL